MFFSVWGPIRNHLLVCFLTHILHIFCVFTYLKHKFLLSNLINFKSRADCSHNQSLKIDQIFSNLIFIIIDFKIFKNRERFKSWLFKNLQLKSFMNFFPKRFNNFTFLKHLHKDFKNFRVLK